MTRSSGADVRKKVDQRTHTGITWLLGISAICILLHFVCPDFDDKVRRMRPSRIAVAALRRK